MEDVANRSKSRKALGRGLGALIPGASAVATMPASTAAGPTQKGVTSLEIDLIDANPHQPRRVFAEEQLATLADSIRQYGVLQPVVVRRAGERYELVVGERRWRASKLAGKQTIPAVVADLAEKDRFEVALVENIQRHDLNPIELALAFQELLAAGSTQDEIGKRVGLQRSTIANHVRLLDLSPEIQEDVEQDRISMGHAKALLQVADPIARNTLRDKILAQGLSVRDAEKWGRPASVAVGAAKNSKAGSTSATSPDPNLNHLLDQLRNHFKTKVRIVGESKGRIEIEFFGVEDLTRLVSLLLDGPRR